MIFTSVRTRHDAAGYDAAAAETARLAAARPGYRGMESVRNADGFGITIRFWADEAAAGAWRDDPVHRDVQERGREVWYDSCRVTVARVERGYAWQRS